MWMKKPTCFQGRTPIGKLPNCRESSESIRYHQKINTPRKRFSISLQMSSCPNNQHTLIARLQALKKFQIVTFKGEGREPFCCLREVCLFYSVYIKCDSLEPFSIDPFGSWAVGFLGDNVCVCA